ncbi:MAG: Gfo/Idh/MocA family oxidoreductase [Verrucomicrobiaceae bacterium]|nr:MAG: Gfo/Idh/MocA family oxidoreductase [Verrucomicrobiaceae bacterium]
MENVRIGIVGLGNMGKAHRDCLRAGKVSGLQLTAICDRNTNLPPPEEGEAQFADVEAMIASGCVDALLIATPHYFHTTVGIAALRAGLHVMVEKPLSVHKADCERLIKAHQGSGQIFAAMFQLRTDPLYRQLKSLVSEGELGPIRRVLWDCTDWFRTETYYTSGGWRATWKGEGGGVLLNQCPHNLDLYQWLFGMPSEVTGFCQFGRYHDIEVEDDVTAYFRYKNGTHATFITSTGEAPGKNLLQITGENGLVTVNGRQVTFQRNRTSMSEFSLESDAGFAKPENWSIDVPVPPGAASHVEVLQNFTDAILHGVPLIAPAAEGLHSIELANAILLSTWKNRTISLPMDGLQYERELHNRISSSTHVRKPRSVKKLTSDDFAKSFK